MQKLPPPKPQVLPEMVARSTGHRGADLCDELCHKNLRAISEQIKSMEHNDNLNAEGIALQSSSAATSSSTLLALRVEEKKIRLIEMQRRVRAQILNHSFAATSASCDSGQWDTTLVNERLLWIFVASKCALSGLRRLHRLVHSCGGRLTISIAAGILI